MEGRALCPDRRSGQDQEELSTLLRRQKRGRRHRALLGHLGLPSALCGTKSFQNTWFSDREEESLELRVCLSLASPTQGASPEASHWRPGGFPRPGPPQSIIIFIPSDKGHLLLTRG